MPVRRRDRNPCPRGTPRALGSGQEARHEGCTCVTRCTENVQNRAPTETKQIGGACGWRRGQRESSVGKRLPSGGRIVIRTTKASEEDWGFPAVWSMAGARTWRPYSCASYTDSVVPSDRKECVLLPQPMADVPLHVAVAGQGGCRWQKPCPMLSGHPQPGLEPWASHKHELRLGRGPPSCTSHFRGRWFSKQAAFVKDSELFPLSIN